MPEAKENSVAHKRAKCDADLEEWLPVQMSVARRLHRRSSQEEQATVQAEVEDPLSATRRGTSDQHTAHLCASAVIKPLKCCAVPMLTLDIESSGCSAAA